LRPLKNEIPALYEKLLPQAFLEQNASENLATCNDCRMCKPDLAAKTTQLDPLNKSTYSPTTKCCTFYPFVANYLVGAALASGGEGAERLRTVIRARQWALPIGLVPPPSYQKKFTDKRPEEFGRNFDFLCPFFMSGGEIKGGCAIWKFRNSECSTYFCAHEEGEIGQTKWAAIGDTLFTTEMKLSQECMLQKGFDWQEVEANLPYVKMATARDLKDFEKPFEMDAVTYHKFWQHHSGDPASYFIDCFQWVSGLKSLP
jgi:hypothetical protein